MHAKKSQSTSPRRFWLMKSEPEAYSILDLERDGRVSWDGIRNYQARNYMRDAMRMGDPVLFYHSRTSPPAVVGVARVCREAYPDHTAWDPESPYHDPRSTPEAPVWQMVDVEFVASFDAPVPLPVLRSTPALDGMLVIKKGQRLSIQPVRRDHFMAVLKLARASAAICRSVGKG